MKSDRIVGVGRLEETRFDLEMFLHHAKGDLFVGFCQPDSLGDGFDESLQLSALGVALILIMLAMTFSGRYFATRHMKVG